MAPRAQSKCEHEIIKSGNVYQKKWYPYHFVTSARSARGATCSRAKRLYRLEEPALMLTLEACCKCAWIYMVTKWSFFNVTLLGNSVRASKAFPVGFFCAVQLSHAWSVALSKRTQLGRPCKPVLNVPVRLRISHVPATPLRPYVRRATEGIHCDRRLSPPAPSSASLGLASLSTHPGAALGGLDTHGVAGGSCT